MDRAPILGRKRCWADGTAPDARHNQQIRSWSPAFVTPHPNSSRVGVLFLLPAPPPYATPYLSTPSHTHRSSTTTTHRRSHPRTVELRGGIPAGIPRATHSRPTYDHDPPRCPLCRPTSGHCSSRSSSRSARGWNSRPTVISRTSTTRPTLPHPTSGRR